MSVRARSESEATSRQEQDTFRALASFPWPGESGSGEIIDGLP